MKGGEGWGKPGVGGAGKRLALFLSPRSLLFLLATLLISTLFFCPHPREAICDGGFVYLCVDTSRQQLSPISPREDHTHWSTVWGPGAEQEAQTEGLKQREGRRGGPLPHSEFSHIAGEGMNVRW